MKITNTTKWDSDDFRKLFSKCITEIRKTEKTGRKQGLPVKVLNGGNDTNAYVWGRAHLGWWGITIKIGRGIDFTDIQKRKELALVFIHEYYHNLGYKSQDRCHYKYDWTKKFNVDFVSDYQIRPQTPKMVPERDLQIERYNKVCKYVDLYKRKLKRYSKVLKGWQGKKNRYEKVLVASGKIKPE